MKEEVIKFLIVGDLHGRMPTIHEKEFDAIICPGDICGDDSRELFKKFIEGNNKTFEEFLEKNKKITQSFEKKSLEKGKKILDYLSSYQKPIFLVSGNWDFSKYCDGYEHNVSIENDSNPFQTLLKKYKNIFYVENTSISFKGITIIGHGSTSGPEILFEEQITDDCDISRLKYFEEKEENFNKLFQATSDPTILISHNVPYGTKLDVISNESNPLNGENYGSILARQLIETFSPLACIGGHIHEGRGKENINSTLCINAGFGSDVNTILTIDVKNKKIKDTILLGKNEV